MSMVFAVNALKWKFSRKTKHEKKLKKKIERKKNKASKTNQICSPTSEIESKFLVAMWNKDHINAQNRGNVNKSS